MDLFSRKHGDLVCSAHFPESAFTMNCFAKLMMGVEKFELLKGVSPTLNTSATVVDVEMPFQPSEQVQQVHAPNKRMRFDETSQLRLTTSTGMQTDAGGITIGTQTQWDDDVKECQAPQDFYDMGKERLLEHSYFSESDTNLVEPTLLSTSTPVKKVKRRLLCLSPIAIQSPIGNTGVENILEASFNSSVYSLGTIDENESTDPTFASGSYAHTSSDSAYSADSVQDISDNKYIVFGTELQALFRFLVCERCRAPTMETSFSTNGSVLVVNFQCTNGHDTTWKSQPDVNRMPMGNLQIAAAVLFGGCNFSSIRTFANLLNLKFIANTTFCSIQRDYLFPVVAETWENHQQSVLDQHKETPLVLAGDGRCDSPGFSAKYGTYTVMTMDTNVILDFSVIQVTEAGNSVAMEKLGLQRVLANLEEKDLNVKVLATDRHVQIRKYLRTEKPEIDHQFDVWHLAKSLGKKIGVKAKPKDCQMLGMWRKSVINHLWWAAATCDGSADILIEKWTSIIHHTVNQHTFPGNYVQECGHVEMSADEENRTKWMKPGTKAHEALKDVVLNKDLLKDIRQLSQFCHTGQLESYHSLITKYCPKRIHYSMEGMEARTKLAALDHNSNVGRKQATVKKGKRKGELRYKTVFPKMSKQWVVKPVYEEKSCEYRHAMVDRVVSGKAQKDLKSTLKKTLPRNIASVDMPSKTELVLAHSSRFS